MISPHARALRGALLILGLLSLAAAPASAQKTDVVTLANGDRLTCEIKVLTKGRLQVSTDDLGTVYIEWDNIVAVMANRVFRVETSSGLRLLGRLTTTEPRHLDVVQETGAVQVDQPDVVYIVPIGQSIWRQMDGSFDMGFSYTQSSGIAQLNVDAGTIYRRPTFQVGGSISSYYTLDDEGDDTSRHALDVISERNFRRRSYWLLQGGFMRNQELGYDLRGTVSAGVGHYLARSNKNYFAVAGGLSTSREVPTDGDSTQQVELLLGVRQSYFTYDRPKTDIGLAVDVYPSLSAWGRVRIELDGRVKREILKDFSIGFSIYNSFDSDPPSEDARKNDVGLSLTIGWTF